MAASTLPELADADARSTKEGAQRATKRLEVIQQRITGAADDTEAMNEKLAKATTEERELKANLEKFATEAEADAIVERLRDLTIEIRGYQAQLQELAESTDRWRGMSAVLQEEVRRATVQAARAEKEDAAEKKENADEPKAGEPPRPPNRAGIRRLLAASTLGDAVGDTTAALATAETHAYKGLPAKLADRVRERARERLATTGGLRASIADVTAAVADLRPTSEGPAGKTALARADFEAAETRARDFVFRGRERLDAILAVLATIKAAPELSAVDHDAIEDASAEAAAGLDLEKTLATKQEALHAAKAAVRKARIAANAAKPDEDPELDPAVKQAQTKLKAARKAVDDAAATYTADERAKVDRLSAAVPDVRWRLIQQLEEIRHELVLLKVVKAKALAQDWETSETALVSAILEDRKAARGLALIRAELAVRNAAVQAAAPTEQSRMFSALRGDG